MAGTNILFENNVVFNGDDCLAVSSPAFNITFRNSYCCGGHGLSIGSLGKGKKVADVENVLYVMEYSLRGVGFINAILEGLKTLSW